MATQFVRPDPSKLFGITHDAGTGSPVLRVTRSLKVGIGLPKGKDIHAYIDANSKWNVRVGKANNRFEKMEEARAYYRKEKDNAPDVNYPRKLPYFIFTRPGPDGSFDPDWETTAAHGPMPREIDIMFTDNRPMQASYAMWTAAELKCSGDGINALRVLSMANNKEQQDLAEQAKSMGEKYFPIENGCFARNCQYAKAEMKNGKEYPAPCKPHAKLQFQLLAQPRLGASAQFDTTSIRSISQLFSCLQTFFTFTGQGDPTRGFIAGIPLKMVLQPFRINHNGQPSTAYSVGLEFRVADATQLKTQLLERAFEWNRSVTPPVAETRQIEAAPIAGDDEDFETPTTRTEAAEAAAFTAEFVDESGEGQGQDADYPQADASEEGSIDHAREKAIDRVVELSGYSRSQIAQFIEFPDTVERCKAEFGEPPNAPRGERAPKVDGPTLVGNKPVPVPAAPTQATPGNGAANGGSKKLVFGRKP